MRKLLYILTSNILLTIVLSLYLIVSLLVSFKDGLIDFSVFYNPVDNYSLLLLLLFGFLRIIRYIWDCKITKRRNKKLNMYGYGKN